MRRPPCCVKGSIKKGPWTPEEDIILVSYIQDHGPGNWRLVPTNTGLMRCSKSCRLRWTNYLRPGIKRGNFTSHEEEIIIQLQALLGNRWAAIASYLPQRTDNDVKNYWNTHLKKKMKKYQCAISSFIAPADSGGSTSNEIMHSGTTNSHILIRSSPTYASSAENISRLLEGWMRSSPNLTLNSANEELNHQMKKECITINNTGLNENRLMIDGDFNLQMPLEDSVIEWDKTSANIVFEENKEFTVIEFDHTVRVESQSLLEKWLLDENAEHVDAFLELTGFSIHGILHLIFSRQSFAFRVTAGCRVGSVKILVVLTYIPTQEIHLDEFIRHEVEFKDISKAFGFLIKGNSLRCIIWMGDLLMVIA